MAGQPVTPVRLVDAYLAAQYVEATFDRDCSPVTIRRWASEGKLDRIGTAGRRAQYNLFQVHEVAARVSSALP